MQISGKKIKFFFIYASFMLIYVNITDRQTYGHTKSIVRNLTIDVLFQFENIFSFYLQFSIQ